MTTELLARHGRPEISVRFLIAARRSRSPDCFRRHRFRGRHHLACVPHVRSGAVRALAVTGKTRWKDIAGCSDGGRGRVCPDFEVISWSGMAAPAADPEAGHRSAACRDPESDQRAGGAQQARRCRRRGARHDAGGDARAGRAPGGDVDQGREGRQYPARLDRRLAQVAWNAAAEFTTMARRAEIGARRFSASGHSEAYAMNIHATATGESLPAFGARSGRRASILPRSIGWSRITAGTT